MKIVVTLMILTLNAANAKDTGLSDAIVHSNIKQLNPKPNIRMKGSFTHKEAIVCEVNPMSGSLLVSINPNYWYELSVVDQINTFCKEMNNCDDRIKCKKL